MGIYASLAASRNFSVGLLCYCVLLRQINFSFSLSITANP